MPKFLEKKLKKEYGAKSKIPYMIMNKMGAMKGNKETIKGYESSSFWQRHASAVRDSGREAFFQE